MIKCVPAEGTEADFPTLFAQIKSVINGENCAVSLAALASVFLLLLESASRDYAADTGRKPPSSWEKLIADIKVFEDERKRSLL